MRATKGNVKQPQLRSPNGKLLQLCVRAASGMPAIWQIGLTRGPPFWSAGVRLLLINFILSPEFITSMQDFQSPVASAMRTEREFQRCHRVPNAQSVACSYACIHIIS